MPLGRTPQSYTGEGAHAQYPAIDATNDAAIGIPYRQIGR